MKNKWLGLMVLLMIGCQSKKSLGDFSSMPVSEYFKDTGEGVRMAGIQMIPIQTPAGIFKVWTKRFGNNPKIKILLLHGGPAGTSEYMECFESFFPAKGYEFYEYDQLGSYRSDQPSDSSLWTVDRFVEEVEQVRRAIGADASNFYLLGNSWGGILAMSYALKYQEHIKGLIIANMMASCPDYDTYAAEVLAKQMDPKVLAEVQDLEAKGEFANPRYMTLLQEHFYNLHICRLPEWPEPVNRSFLHMNPVIYTMMQGPSEFGISGRLATWDVKSRLKEIKTPTLVIGAKHDTMDPAHMEWMSNEFPNGEYLFCPNGSHLAMWDDQQVFMGGVIAFIDKTNESH
jgi:proline iminopeptidase